MGIHKVFHRRGQSISNNYNNNHNPLCCRSHLFFFCHSSLLAEGEVLKSRVAFCFPSPSSQTTLPVRYLLYSGLRPYNPRPPKDTYRLYLRLPPPPPSVTNLKFLLPRRSHALFFSHKGHSSFAIFYILLSLPRSRIPSFLAGGRLSLVFW